MITVKARPGESIDELLKRFKNVVDDDGILKDIKKHEYYEKPSVRNKRKRSIAKNRWIKLNKKNERFLKPKKGNDFKWDRSHSRKIPINRKNTFNRGHSK